MDCAFTLRLDPDLQKDADEAATRRVAEFGNPRLGAAFASADPQTDYIAMVGDRTTKKSQYNIATSSNRQMGSSFKMYTLVAALSEGVFKPCSNGNSLYYANLVGQKRWYRCRCNYTASRYGLLFNTVHAQVVEALSR